MSVFYIAHCCIRSYDRALCDTINVILNQPYSQRVCTLYIEGARSGRERASFISYEYEKLINKCVRRVKYRGGFLVYGFQIQLILEKKGASQEMGNLSRNPFPLEYIR